MIQKLKRLVDQATCIGSNNGTATSLLKQDYKDDLTIQEAMSLACKVLSKTMDSTTLDSEKSESHIWISAIVARFSSSDPCYFLAVEFATLSLDQSGKPLSRIFRPTDITRLLDREGLAKKSEEEGAAPRTAEAMAVDST